MEIVSGRTGKPHVTSQQFRQIIEGIISDDSCILPSGENLEPELVSNNSLKIRSGMMCHHGNVSSVKIGTYDEVELTNGSQGMKRIDLIVNRYTRNEEDNTEKNEWVVIMGTPAESSPVVPEYTQGDLQKGDLLDDCPVFEVHFDGINIVEVTKKLEIAKTNKDLADKLTELNKNIACSPSVKRQETLVSFQRNQRYKIEHTGQIQFACAFSSTQGYCRIYVYNSSGEIVYREQLNPAPVSSNEVATGQLAVFEGWEFLAESYNALVAGAPKYTLTY